MNRRKFIGFIPLVLCAPAIVRAQTLNMLNSGSVAKVAAATGFTGIGDIVAAQSWWGARAYSAATRGTANCKGNTGTVQNTYSTGATTGANNDALMTSDGNIRWFTLFDQAGAYTLNSTANDPIYVASGLGAHSIIQTADGGGRGLTGAASFTRAQPFSINLLSQYPVGGATQVVISAAAGGSTPSCGYDVSGNAAFIQAGGTTHTATVTDGVWHSLTFVFNGASSKIIVDGSSSGVSIGATGYSGDTVSLGLGSGNLFDILEFGIFSGDISSSATTIFNNQKTYWGF